MTPQFPAIRPHPGRLRPRHSLIGLACAAVLVLASILTRGGIPHTTAASSAAQSAAPSNGHAQVIAQAVVDLPDDPLAWSVATIEAGERSTGIARDGAPGFLLGSEGAVIVRDAANARTRLAGGEALAVRPEGALTVQATGEEPASVSLLTLGRAGGEDLGAALTSGEAFASPGGSRDVELVGDVLAEGETARITAGDTPIFVVVTGGAVAIEKDADETQVLQAGDSVLVAGDLIVTGAAEDPARFVAAVIGPEVDAAAESADPENSTPGAQTPSRPRPTSPASAPTPRSSPTPSSTPTPTPVPPTPTPEGNGPTDDPDGDGLVNQDEDTLGTDRHDPDTEYDLLSDGDEVHTYKTNPTALDTDDDGLYDGDEVIRVGSNPAVADSDGDGLPDGQEANEFLTNPLDDDTDHDDYDDYNEVLRGTDPRVVDTDGDGVADGVEVTQYRTNPLVYDTDGDGVADGDEVYYYQTNPNDPDTDHDGLNEAEEAFLTTDPRNSDTDGDGYSDGAEVYDHRTWPLDPESHP